MPGPVSRQVDVKLPEKVNSNSHGARPVHLIITMIKWIWTSGLSMKNSLSLDGPGTAAVEWIRTSRLSIKNSLSLACIRVWFQSSCGFRVQGVGCRVSGSGFRDQGSGFRIQVS